MIDLLVVEDEPGVQEFVRLAMEGQNVNCRFAASAERALKLTCVRWPDVILLDLALAGCFDGWQLWERLVGLAHSRELRVIVFGGEISSEAEAEARCRGARAIVRKPVMPLALLRAIGQASSGILQPDLGQESHQ